MAKHSPSGKSNPDPEFQPNFVEASESDDRSAFAARVHGKAMEPDFPENTIVIFTPSAPVRSGDDALVKTSDGRMMFRRVYLEVEGVRLVARNPREPQGFIRAIDVEGLYRATFCYRPCNLGGAA